MSDKKVRSAVRKHVMSILKQDKTFSLDRLVDNITFLRSPKNSKPISYACAFYVDHGFLLNRTSDKRKFLLGLGFDEKKIDSYQHYGGGANGLYTALASRELAGIYNERKAKHPTRYKG